MQNFSKTFLRLKMIKTSATDLGQHQKNNFWQIEGSFLGEEHHSHLQVVFGQDGVSIHAVIFDGEIVLSPTAALVCTGDYSQPAFLSLYNKSRTYIQHLHLFIGLLQPNVQVLLTHGSPQELRTTQYSTPFSSTPQPATDTMWFIYGSCTYSEYTPPVYASSLAVAMIPQLQKAKSQISILV